MLLLVHRLKVAAALVSDTKDTCTFKQNKMLQGVAYIIDSCGVQRTLVVVIDVIEAKMYWKYRQWPLK